MNEKTVPVIGCTRFDFYTDRFRATIMPREMFCQQHNFDPSRKIVTWATAFGYAGIQRDPARLKRFLSEAELNGLSQCYRRIGIEPSRVPEMHEAARDASSRAFVALAKARPDVQFILRPHPVDDRNYFRRLIDENALKNTRFCPQDYIWNILAASDVHLHRQCTTAVEAWMWDKPTIEMDMENIAEWRWSDREMGSDTAHDKHELIELVDGYLSGSSVDGDVLSYRKSYVEKWFGPQDGRRCAAAADAIDQLLVGRSRTRRRFDPIAGIESTSRAVVSAVLRHMLGKLPNESILRSVPATQLDPMDKMVTRRDVKAYKSLIAAAVN